MKKTSQMKLKKYRMIAVIIFGVYMPILRMPMEWVMDIVNFSHSDYWVLIWPIIRTITHQLTLIIIIMIPLYGLVRECQIGKWVSEMITIGVLCQLTLPLIFFRSTVILLWRRKIEHWLLLMAIRVDVWFILPASISISIILVSWVTISVLLTCWIHLMKTMICIASSTGASGSG